MLRCNKRTCFLSLLRLEPSDHEGGYTFEVIEVIVASYEDGPIAMRESAHPPLRMVTMGRDTFPVLNPA